MSLSNQYPSVIYGISSSGGLLPLGTLNVSNSGQLILAPSSGLQPGSFNSSYNSSADLQAIPTAGVIGIVGTIAPVMNGATAGKLDFYQLQNGGGGNFQPNDYNATTNNVSWFQVL